MDEGSKPQRRKRGSGFSEPERPQMAILSELLDFPHHRCARGRTVTKDFVVDLAVALGAKRAQVRTKATAFHTAWELATGSQFDDQLSGDTITAAHLDVIIDGIDRRSLGKVDLCTGGGAVRLALARTILDPGGRAIDDLDLCEERKDELRSVPLGRDASGFRSKVLRAYDHRCAITGCDVAETLDAAHIDPTTIRRADAVKNGLCLRADLHRLWLTGRLAIDESSHEVILASDLIGTDYGLLAKEVISIPRNAASQPSGTSLQRQREWAGL
jgi:hypothetical protein